MTTMNSMYTRNIRIIDHNDDGRTAGVTSLATIAQDLVFMFDVNRVDYPEVFDAIMSLETAYINGEPCDEFEQYLGIELRAC